jgi:hypothetical protein
MDTIKTCFYTFSMSDCEDPYLYAAAPIHKWQQSEHGKWCMEHSQDEPTFFCNADPHGMGYRVAIMGHLAEKDLTFFNLKWGNQVDRYRS